MQNPHLEGSAFFWPAGKTGVLLIHGFTATTAEVRPLGRSLLAAGYTVSGPLLPGHGTTPEQANRYSWRDYAATVADAYQEIKKHCSTVFIGGESMGGLLALYQACESPEIAGLLLFAPAIQLATARAARLGPLFSPFLPVLEKPHGPITPADALWQGYTVYPMKA
ncbi:MAG: alpha/beta fold hydrolase, partial [Anaerolineales bacterium]|nr:alpha/beta fold hydrolase [Anaerolineales bacterium]